MFALRRASILELSVLLAAAAALADTIVTADEVIRCSVESADADSVRVRLERPQGRPRSTRDVYERCLTHPESRTLATWSVLEIRLSDSAGVAGLAAQLPGVKVTRDAGQPVRSASIRAREILRLRLDRTRAAREQGLAWRGVVDPLPRNASPDEMAARCRDMEFVLGECGRSDGEIARLRREVSDAQRELRGIWPRVRSCCLFGLLGGVPGTCIGFSRDVARDRAWSGWVEGCPHFPYGAAVGCAVGSAASAATGTGPREMSWGTGIWTTSTT